MSGHRGALNLCFPVFLFFCFFCDFPLTLGPVKCTPLSEVTFYSRIGNVLHHKLTGLDEDWHLQRKSGLSSSFWGSSLNHTECCHYQQRLFTRPLKKTQKTHLYTHFCLLTAIWIWWCKFGSCFVGIADLLNCDVFIWSCRGTSKFGLLLILELWDKTCVT